MAAASLMKWSSFSLNPRSPDVAETSGYKQDDATENSSGLPRGTGLHPAAADLQHELAEDVLDVEAEGQQLVPLPTSDADGLDGRWDTEHLPENWFSWKKLWRFTGPGFLMSIAYIVSNCSHAVHAAHACHSAIQKFQIPCNALQSHHVLPAGSWEP